MTTLPPLDGLTAAIAEFMERPRPMHQPKIEYVAAILADPAVLAAVEGLVTTARATAEDAVIWDLVEEIEAWQTEGLGTCPGIGNTNYPDAWASVVEKAWNIRIAHGERLTSAGVVLTDLAAEEGKQADG